MPLFETDVLQADQINRLLRLRPAFGGAVRGETIERLCAPGVHAYSRGRQYRVYLPPGLDTNRPAPLVVVLHGCQQSHEDIQQITAFDTIADRERCIVVYPYVTSYLGYRGRNCWGWWLKAHRTRGQGEVEDIWRVVEEVRQDFPIDPRRIHVAGLSAGASMAVACLVAHGDRIASGASVAGLAYGESASAVNDTVRADGMHKSVSRLVTLLRSGLQDRELPGLLVIQSNSDTVVSPQAADGLEESWRQVSELGRPRIRFRGRTRQVPWTYIGYCRGTRQRLACLRVNGPAHGWVGGRKGRFSTPEGPAISELIWSHFTNNPGRWQASDPADLPLAS